MEVNVGVNVEAVIEGVKKIMQKKIDELEVELKIARESNEDLARALRGTIIEEGYYYSGWNANGTQYKKWEINMSSIISSLIKTAAKFCDCYASDIFFDLRMIDETLRNGEELKPRYVFGFRDSGVDHEDWYELHKDDYKYYMEVWFLDVETDNNKIKMCLHK